MRAVATSSNLLAALALLIAVVAGAVEGQEGRAVDMPQQAEVRALSGRADENAFSNLAVELHGRQAQTTSAASSSSASSTGGASTSSSSSGAEASTGGGSVQVTEPASVAPPSGCSMTNQLSGGQSASWTETTASTCCTNATASTCFFRMQSSVNSTAQCIIPNCSILASGDTSRMAGFKPLSTTTGSGGNNNTFTIHSNGAGAGRLAVPASIAITALGLLLLSS
ncbi:unnamed protein product [Parajaminaea phylloscopi]